MNWLTFHLERVLLRGSHYRLLFMAAGVVVVAVGGGLALAAMGEAESTTDAIWWAFLRLTDPGYLGDDQGLGRRSLATLITVLGYVLFMGALIAILTQWLHETVERLQRGETPIVVRDHLLVLGLTRRTPVVLEQLLRSETRIRRFLRGRGAGRLTIVVLVEDLDEAVRAELSDDLGELWDDRAIVLRSGSPLNAEHLDRVDFARAAAILIPGGLEMGDSLASRDANTVKTLLSIANHPAIRSATQHPRMVAEVSDDRLPDLVETLYPGSVELVPSDTIVSKLMAQNLRHRGLSWVLTELLAFHEGKDIFYLRFPESVGTRFGDVARRIRGGVALGVVRPTGAGGWTPFLNPPSRLEVGPDDRFVVVAADLGAIRLDVAPDPTGGRLSEPLQPFGVGSPSPRRVLILGWNRRVPALVRELDSYRGESFEVEVFSVVAVVEREAALDRLFTEPRRTPVRHRVGDYTSVGDLAGLDLTGYHNIVILGRGWIADGESSDAQTILAYSIVDARLRPVAARPTLLIELADPQNAELFSERPGELVLSPVLMAHILAHIAIRPELGVVLEELFTVGGAEFHFREPAEYGLDGGPHSFLAMQTVVAEHDETLVGVRVSASPIDIRNDLVLAPDAEATFDLSSDALLLVLTTLPAAEMG